MRVGYSATTWDDARSGLGTYMAEQIALLYRRDDVDIRVIEFGGRVLPRGHLPQRSGTGSGIHHRWRPVRDVLWHRWRLAPLAARHHMELVHVPTIRRLPASLSCRAVVTVHDLAPLRMPGKYGRARQLYHERVVPRWLRAVDAVITPSHATKDDLVHFYGVESDRITVIANGVNHDLYYPGDPEHSARILTQRYGLAPPFLVYIARLEHPAKNHVRLIEAFRRFKERYRTPHKLVLVGSPWHGHEIIERSAAPLVESKELLITGYVPREDLPHFLRAAEALVVPSLYEGFGMPVLDAMACGTPVVCSRSSSLTELAEGSGVLFDPTCTEAIMDALERVVSDEALRGQLREEGLKRAQTYTWWRSVEETVRVWRLVLERR